MAEQAEHDTFVFVPTLADPIGQICRQVMLVKLNPYMKFKQTVECRISNNNLI